MLLALACARPHAGGAPQRVVTLAPNVTEMMFAIGAGDLVCGTDDVSDYPPQAAHIAKVGAGIQPNIEKIVALKPDLVIAVAAGLHPSLSRSLESQHIPLLVVRTDRLRDVPAAMLQIGTALHRNAQPAVASMQRALAAQRRTRARAPRVMFAVWTDPLYVAGVDTFTNDLFAMCGATNAVTVSGWPKDSLESFIAAPPDVLIYPNRSVTPAQVAALVARAGVKPQVVPIDENVFTRPGPRVSQAAAALNAILDGRPSPGAPRHPLPAAAGRGSTFAPPQRGEGGRRPDEGPR
jgi:ABC-type hemin transport system substrate-binding protein